nr:hypothetical protein [Tanacetum cinerariifolium]
MYAIDVEPIPSRLRNNWKVHLDYLKHPKENVATLHEIVKEAKKHVVQQITQKTNVPVLPSTGVDSCTDASGSNPRSNTKKNTFSPAKSVNKKTVEVHSRTNKSQLQKPNSVDSSISSKRTVINSNSDSACKTCNKCFISANHDMCVIKYSNYVNASSSAKNVVHKVKQVWKPKHVKQVWTTTGKVLTTVGYQWKPMGRIFTLKEQCLLTRFIHPKVVHAKQPKNVSTSKSVITKTLSHTSQKPLTRYQRRNKQNTALLAGIPTPTDAAMQSAVVQSVLWYLDSDCSKHMTGDRSRLRNFVKMFIGTIRFENDHLGAIMRKYSCYVYDTDGVELIKGSRGSNLYTISVKDMMKSSPIYLLSKASKTKSWLWHHRLNHLKFGTINDLARKDLVRGLPRLKFEKDHLCFACQLGKSKKHTHIPKAENTNLEVLNTLRMDLCGPMRVQIINGKKYMLVIIDDYTWFTWVKFLRSKDETPEVVIKFLKQIHIGVNKTIRFIRTDNGTEFVNHDLTY